MWVAYSQLLQVYGSLLDGSNAAQLGGYQVPRDSPISQIYQVLEHITSGRSNLPISARQVTLHAARLKFVLAACHQLLRLYGMLPGEYTHPVQANNAPQIHPPAPETAQPGGDTSGRFHCVHKDCKATFKRLQERKRHLIDVHTPRRRCPFCPRVWSRPDKIKTHLMEKHQDRPRVLNEIRAKRGRRLVMFLNTLCDDAVKQAPSQGVPALSA